MRASKDGEGKVEHALSAFCGGLQTILGNEASRGKGFEIPDALKLLERLDLKGKIVTGDAIFCQKSITAQIVEGGGDYVFPVKDNQKNLKDAIEMAFNAPVFPLSRWDSGVEKAHGRIERRTIDVLPAKAAGIEREWPTVRRICRVRRWRRQKMQINVRHHGGDPGLSRARRPRLGPRFPRREVKRRASARHCRAPGVQRGAREVPLATRHRAMPALSAPKPVTACAKARGFGSFRGPRDLRSGWRITALTSKVARRDARTPRTDRRQRRAHHRLAQRCTPRRNAPRQARRQDRRLPSRAPQRSANAHDMARAQSARAKDSRELPAAFRLPPTVQRIAGSPPSPDGSAPKRDCPLPSPL